MRLRMPVVWRLRQLRARRVRRRLLRDEDTSEDIVDEVFHHWIVYLLPMLEVALAGLGVWAFLMSSLDTGVVLIVAILALLGHAAWRSSGWFMDVFVVTSFRVFRVRGVLTSTSATTPLARILDITVHQPFLGMILGYGHFTFESAAQEQGLRNIRYVPHPLARDLKIQRHVQLSGLRGPRLDRST